MTVLNITTRLHPRLISLVAIGSLGAAQILAQVTGPGAEQHPAQTSSTANAPEISDPRVQPPVSPAMQSGTQKLPNAPSWRPGEPVRNMPDLKKSEPSKN